jgi:hypothetical protein
MTLGVYCLYQTSLLSQSWMHTIKGCSLQYVLESHRLLTTCTPADVPNLGHLQNIPECPLFFVLSQSRGVFMTVCPEVVLYQRCTSPINLSNTAFTRLYFGDCFPSPSAAKMRSALRSSASLSRVAGVNITSDLRNSWVADTV